MRPSNFNRRSSGFYVLLVAAIAIFAYQSLKPELKHEEREANLLKQWSSTAPPPWPVFIVVNLVHTILSKLDPLRYIAPHQLFDACTSNMKHALLAVAVRHHLAEALAAAPLSARELADATNLDENRLERVMEILVVMRLFEKTPEKKYRNTDMSALLRESHPNSMLPYISHATSFAYEPTGLLWAQLPIEKANAKSSAYQQYWGMEFFQHLASEPSREKSFTKGLAALDIIETVPIVEDFPWGQQKRVIDFGGASGSVSRRMVAKYPQLKTLVFDSPSVVEGRANTSNVEFMGGNFFNPETFPVFQDGDTILLKNVLHDWDDEASVQILTNLFIRAAGRKVRIAVVEGSPVGEATGSFGQVGLWIHGLPVMAWRKRIFDMFMLVLHNGRERSVEQIWYLLNAGGWNPEKAVPTRSHLMITTAKNF